MRSLLSLLGVRGFREDSIPPEEWIHIDFKDGGLGDHICRLTALNYIKKIYPFLKLSVSCPDFFIDFAKTAIPEIRWYKYSDKKQLTSSQPAISAGSDDGISSLRTHLIDHAFMKIVDEQVPIEEKNYLQISPIVNNFNLPNNYVVITTNYTAKVREFGSKVVNEIVDFIKNKGYEVVFLGNEKSDCGGAEDIIGYVSDAIDFSKGIDLKNKTTLLEAHSILANSKCVIGLDNGLLHLAATTSVPIIMGFTTVAPEHRLPIRNNVLGWNVFTVVPEESLKCRFCQSKMNFVYNHDFRNCYYKDYLCIKNQTANPYISHLEKLI